MHKEIITKENIVLNLASESKIEAIERAGKLLVKNGYVSSDYIEGMKARENEISTYMGNGVAILMQQTHIRRKLTVLG